MTDLTHNVFAQGQCTCGDVHYELAQQPMFVHCCHCSWCQRESGSAFALNALIESTQLHVTQGSVEMTKLPTASGGGQDVARCPSCKVALWSHYAGAYDKVAFVRVGTLRQPALCPPDVHIFTSTKLPWVSLTDGKPVMDAFYRFSELWPVASIERYKAAVKG
ncbi:MAG: GFA family protein [Reinekea sp.]|nr:GFA family protein [Reinekea sp.]